MFCGHSYPYLTMGYTLYLWGENCVSVLPTPRATAVGADYLLSLHSQPGTPRDTLFYGKKKKEKMWENFLANLKDVN